MFKYIRLCRGNPGAINFLLSAYDINDARAEAIFQRMKDNNIAGAELYMLWNDCCGRDTRLAMRIAQFASMDDIRTHINYEGGRGYPFTEDELHAAFRMYALPIDPSLEGGVELQKELLPVRKEFLEYMQLMQVGLRSFLAAHPMPEIPQKFKDSVARNRM